MGSFYRLPLAIDSLLDVYYYGIACIWYLSFHILQELGHGRGHGSKVDEDMKDTTNTLGGGNGVFLSSFSLATFNFPSSLELRLTLTFDCLLLISISLTLFLAYIFLASFHH